MAGAAQLVKICQISQIIPVCDITDLANPIRLKEVVVVDANGEIISHDSTTYPSTGTGFTGDGSGFIRSYFTDLLGNPIADAARPALGNWDYDCPEVQVDLELGCMVDLSDISADPIPVRVDNEIATDGTITTSYVSLLDGSAVVPVAGTLEFRPNCDRFDYEQLLFCVRDAAGLIVANVKQVSVYDTEEADGDGLLAPSPIAQILINLADNSEYVLAAGEVLGNCDVFAPLFETGCLLDQTNNTARQARQVITVVDGAPLWTSPQYLDPALGTVIPPIATETWIAGTACTICVTC